MKSRRLRMSRNLDRDKDVKISKVNWNNMNESKKMQEIDFNEFYLDGLEKPFESPENESDILNENFRSKYRNFSIDFAHIHNQDMNYYQEPTNYYQGNYEPDSNRDFSRSSMFGDYGEPSRSTENELDYDPEFDEEFNKILDEEEENLAEPKDEKKNIAVTDRDRYEDYYDEFPPEEPAAVVPSWYSKILQKKQQASLGRLRSLSQCVSYASCKARDHIKQVEQDHHTPFCKMNPPRHPSINKPWQNYWRFNCVIKCKANPSESNHAHTSLCEEIVLEHHPTLVSTRTKNIFPMEFPKHVMRTVELFQDFINESANADPHFRPDEVPDTVYERPTWCFIKLRTNYKNEIMMIVNGKGITPVLESLKKFFRKGPGRTLNVTSLWCINVRWSQKKSKFPPTYLYGQLDLRDKVGPITINYSAKNSLSFNSAEAELLGRIMMEYLEPNDDTTVIDIGCNFGALSLMLATKSDKVIGLNTLDHELKLAEEIKSYNKLHNASFIVCTPKEVLTKCAPFVKKCISVAVLNLYSTFGKSPDVMKSLRNLPTVWRVALYGTFNKEFQKHITILTSSDHHMGEEFLPMQGCILERSPTMPNEFSIVVVFERKSLLEPSVKLIGSGPTLNIKEDFDSKNVKSVIIPGVKMSELVGRGYGKYCQYDSPTLPKIEPNSDTKPLVLRPNNNELTRSLPSNYDKSLERNFSTTISPNSRCDFPLKSKSAMPISTDPRCNFQGELVLSNVKQEPFDQKKVPVRRKDRNPVVSNKHTKDKHYNGYSMIINEENDSSRSNSQDLNLRPPPHIKEESFVESPILFSSRRTFDYPPLPEGLPPAYGALPRNYITPPSDFNMPPSGFSVPQTSFDIPPLVPNVKSPYSVVKNESEQNFNSTDDNSTKQITNNASYQSNVFIDAIVKPEPMDLDEDENADENLPIEQSISTEFLEPTPNPIEPAFPRVRIKSEPIDYNESTGSLEIPELPVRIKNEPIDYTELSRTMEQPMIPIRIKTEPASAGDSVTITMMPPLNAVQQERAPSTLNAEDLMSMPTPIHTPAALAKRNQEPESPSPASTSIQTIDGFEFSVLPNQSFLLNTTSAYVKQEPVLEEGELKSEESTPKSEPSQELPRIKVKQEKDLKRSILDNRKGDEVEIIAEKNTMIIKKEKSSLKKEIKEESVDKEDRTIHELLEEKKKLERILKRSSKSERSPSPLRRRSYRSRSISRDRGSSHAYRSTNRSPFRYNNGFRRSPTTRERLSRRSPFSPSRNRRWDRSPSSPRRRRFKRSPVSPSERRFKRSPISPSDRRFTSYERQFKRSPISPSDRRFRRSSVSPSERRFKRSPISPSNRRSKYSSRSPSNRSFSNNRGSRYQRGTTPSDEMNSIYQRRTRSPSMKKYSPLRDRSGGTYKSKRKSPSYESFDYKSKKPSPSGDLKKRKSSPSVVSEKKTKQSKDTIRRDQWDKKAMSELSSFSDTTI